MDRRAFKKLITKRSSIWTLSLCLTGALTLGGIALIDNALSKDEEKILETEVHYDHAEASGTSVEEINHQGMVNGNLMQEEITDTLMDENTDEIAAEIAEGIKEGTVIEESADAITENIDSIVQEELSDAASGAVISEQLLMDAGIAFSEEDALIWPSAGTILIDYSMDSSVYFETLNQYKYNPALIIGSEVGNQVLASASGIVESILAQDETGITLVLNIGNGYKLTYGQLKELAVAEGDIVECGAVLGYVNEPTKYFVEEGSNLYFGMTHEGNAVDPILYMEG